MSRYDERTFRLAQELRRKSVARLREAGKVVPDREESGVHNFRSPVELPPQKHDGATAVRIHAVTNLVPDYPPGNPATALPRKLQEQHTKLVTKLIELDNTMHRLAPEGLSLHIPLCVDENVGRHEILVVDVTEPDSDRLSRRPPRS